MLLLPISKVKETEPHLDHFFQNYTATEEPGQYWNMPEYEVLLPFSVWNPQKQILRRGFESKWLEVIPGSGEMREEREGSQ